MSDLAPLVDELCARRALLDLAHKELAGAKTAVEAALRKVESAHRDCWEVQMLLYRSASGGREPLAFGG